VEELRKRKGRIDKPFALMALNVETIRQYCEVNTSEERLLVSPHRPIVLLRKKSRLASPGDPSQLSQGVAPGQNTLGVMLPYTPLHELLLEPEEGFPRLLVMTSGNVREEPIATSNEEALSRLSSLADAFLLHNRDIHIRCDDSVVRVFEEQELPIRRSRGYSPYPVKLPFPIQPTLAMGGELKNTFCVAREDYAFLSQHIGDMENYETLKSFESSVSHFENLFRIHPKRLAYDLHPNYLATRYAFQRSQKEGIIAVGVQHHHAHIAACMAENRLSGDQPVLGVAFDGTGFGTDEAIWGGEFLICTYGGFERFAHLAYVPLPGGDAAVRKPCRMALSYLKQAEIQWSSELPCVATVSDVERSVIAHQLKTGLNSPPTSSVGRLFDAVASLLDIRQAVNYEGQAAIELESVCDPEEFSAYSLPPCSGTSLEVSSLFPEILKDMKKGVPVPIIAAKFHNSLAALILRVAQRLRRERQIREVLLSGGVFQNVTLLKRALDLLREADFVVYTHRLVPPNDGGISLGQAMVASRSGLFGGE
jgi:hydrogenase maturation protein HypF